MKKVLYVTDSANWVIREIGLSLKKYLLNVNFNIKKNVFLNIGGIHHYSTRYAVKKLHYRKPFTRNIVTYFHGEDHDIDLLKSFKKNQKNIDLIHTSCEKTRLHLVSNGIDEKKIRVIPIGIEVGRFSNIRLSEKERLRESLGIPRNSFVIGSFQKDGVGWGDGNEPKLVKGPDLFCDAMELLSKKMPIFVLLTGPSRGYVKNRLTESRIAYRHDYLENYYDVSKYFNVIDAYLVSSRVEGGPRAPMEAQASGVPVVSTDVGQVDQVIEDGVNGLVVPVDDTQAMAEALKKIYNDSELRERLVKNGLESVKRFDYSVISKEYENLLYKPLF